MDECERGRAEERAMMLHILKCAISRLRDGSDDVSANPYYMLLVEGGVAALGMVANMIEDLHGHDVTSSGFSASATDGLR